MHKTDTPVRFGNIGGSVLGTGFASDVIKQISEAVRYSQEHNNTQYLSMTLQLDTPKSTLSLIQRAQSQLELVQKL